jgi:uncharacterized protein
MDPVERTTYVLVDGENIDATLGTSILGRRPRPEERPRWERLLRFAERTHGQPVRGLFFLAVTTELPMAFVQALLAIGYRPVALTGEPDQKVVDIAVQRTLTAIRDRDADVLLVSNDGDFVEQVEDLLDGRRSASSASPRSATTGSSSWPAAAWRRTTSSTTGARSSCGSPGCVSSRSTISTPSCSSDPELPVG